MNVIGTKLVCIST